MTYVGYCFVENSLVHIYGTSQRGHNGYGRRLLLLDVWPQLSNVQNPKTTTKLP